MTTTDKCKKLVDEELKKLLETNQFEDFYNPIREHIFAGGKRVRPVFCMLTCEALGTEIQKAVPVAAAIELVQAFSLVHDDIADRDDFRRGLPTLWKQVGDWQAMNMGDGIFTKSIEAMGNYTGENLAEILKTFSKGVMDMCEGQALDMMYENRDSITLDDYYRMSVLKTGCYIATSLKLGAVIAGEDEKVQDEIYDAGRKLGLAYQIWDDYIDFASDNTGKTKGSDIKKGKKTVIVCHALENLEEADKKELLEILKTSIEATTDEMINRAVEILEKSGSIQYAKDYAVKLVNEAKEKLGVLPASEAKTEILKIADFFVERDV